MSIYGTILSLDDEHAENCAVWVEVEEGIREFGDRECDCGMPKQPLVYAGSHILPSDEDSPRGGWVEMASINGEVTRPGRGAPRAYEDHHPWLRLGVGEEGRGDATVVLTKPHARRMFLALGEWLGGPALSLEDVDELLEVIRIHNELVGGLGEYECLPRLRELRAALADAMERYEGKGSDARA